MFTRVKKQTINHVHHVDESCPRQHELTKKKTDNQWVAYSDSENNTTYSAPFGRKEYSSLEFMEPVYVIKTKHGFCKVIAYDPAVIKRGEGLLSSLRNSEYGYRLTDHKGAVYKGWIKEDHLIHSQEAKVCGFNHTPVKYFTGICSPTTIVNQDKLLHEDSLLISHQPGYQKEIKGMIPLHDWVYVYKNIESTGQVLVGTRPFLNPDSLEGTFGWIADSSVIPQAQNSVLISQSKPLIARWLTERQSRYGSDSSELNLSEQSLLGKQNPILPTHISIASALSDPKKEIQSFVPMELVDLKNSHTVNCMGRSIHYSKQKSLGQSLKKINIVLVFEDGEEGKEALSNMLSSFPDIYQKTRSQELRDYTFSWGALGYQGRDISDSLPMTTDFSKWLNFVQQSSKDTTIQYRIYEHVMLRGLQEAGRILKNHPDEHNVVLVVGSKVDPDIFDNYLKSVVENLSAAAASLVFVQSNFDKADHYSDFMLQAKQILALVGKGSAKARKNYIVDNSYLRYKNQLLPYNRCGSGYIFDFPNASMQKGGIFFPPMEEQICPDILRPVMDSLFRQIQNDTERLLSDLKNNFKTVNRFEQQVNPLLQKILFDKGQGKLPDSVRNSTNAPFYVEFYTKPGIDSTGQKKLTPAFVFHQDEFATFLKTLRQVVIDPKVNRDGDSDVDRKDRKRWYKELKDICKSNAPFFDLKGPVKSTTLAEVIFMETGYPVQNELFHETTIKKIGSRNGIEMDELRPELIYFYDDIFKLEAFPSENENFVLHQGSNSYYLIPAEQLP